MDTMGAETEKRVDTGYYGVHKKTEKRVDNGYYGRRNRKKSGYWILWGA